MDSCLTLSPATRGPVKAAAYSWKDIMHIDLIEQSCERSIVPELQRILAEYVVESSVTDLRERYYDYFPMEELLSAGHRPQDDEARLT